MSFPDNDPPRSPDPSPFDLPFALPDEFDRRDPVPLCSDDIPIPMPSVPAPPPIYEDEPEVVWPFEVECRQCGWVDSPHYGRCERCGAWLTQPPVRPRPRQPGLGRPRGLAVVLVAYGLLMMVTIGWVVVIVTSGAKLNQDEQIAGLAYLEAIHTIIVLFTLAIVGRIAIDERPPGALAGAWIAAWPVLVTLILGSVAFSELLRWLFNAPRVPGPGVTVVTVLLICVQPAIVEELFFRHVAFGVLRRDLSPLATALITSVMFAISHIGNPLGMPYLFVAGVVFGYARLYGGLPLSMLMHFLHNLAVISIDAIR